MKKIILNILALLVITSCTITMSAFAEEKSISLEEISQKAELLKTLGIINSIQDEENGNKSISRAEFVTIAGKALKINNGAENKSYFNDVDKNSESASYINQFVELNFISYPENKLFRPEDKISENEALKILLCMAGYGEYAISTGGYPEGFAETAAKLDFEKTGSDKELSLYDAYIMLYDTLRIPIFEKTSAGNGLIKYEEDEDTLLSRYFDVYEAEGIVTQSTGVSLDGETLKGKTNIDTRKIVVINEMAYTSEISFFGNLGKNTGVFYRQENEDDTPEIIGTFKVKDRSEVIDVRLKDFVSYNDRRITYYDENKKEMIEIPSGAIIINNGTVVRYEENEAFANLGKSGYIRMVDTEGDNSVDYVLIWKYENVFVESIAGEDLVISDGLSLRDEAKPLMLSEQATEKIVVIEKSDGTFGKTSDITSGKLISVYESDGYLRVVINGISLSGTVAGISTEDDTMKLSFTSVGGIAKEYELNHDYYNIVYSPDGQGKQLEVGAKLEIFSDTEGRIGYITGGISSKWMYVYLIRLINDEDFDRTLMKVLTQDGEITTIVTTEKLVIDGKKTGRSYKDVENALTKETVENGEHLQNGQILRIMTNSNGDITEIDSSKKGNNETDYSMTFAGSHNNTVWRNYPRAFAVSGHVIFGSEDAVHFGVPSPAELEDAEDKDFFICTTDTYTGNNLSVTCSVKAYKVNPENLNCDAFEVNIKSNTGSTPYKYTRGIVLSKSKIMRNDSELEDKLEIASLTTGSSSYWYADSEENKFSEVSVGDVVEIRTNNRKELVDAYKIYDYKQKKTVGTTFVSATPHNPANNISYYFGNIWERDEDLLKINLNPEDYDGKYENSEYDFAIRFRNGRVPVVVYDGKSVTVEDLATLATESQFAEEERPDQKYIIVTQNMLMKSIVYIK